MGCCEIVGNSSKQTLVITDNYNFTYTKYTKNYQSNNKTITTNANSEYISTTNREKLKDDLRNTTAITEKAEVKEFNYNDILLNQNIYSSQRNANFIKNKHKNKESYGKSTLNIINNSKYDIPKMKEINIPKIEVQSEIILLRKKLVLTVIEAKYLEIGTQLIINAGGLEGSERCCKDGVALFGNRSFNKLENDFNFPDEEKIGNKHFEIRYFEDSDNYCVKDLYGTGLFIKVTQPIKLKNNSIFSFIDSHIIVKIPTDLNNKSFEESKDCINRVISFKVLYGENKDKEYTFNANDKGLILFGRGRSIMNNIQQISNTEFIEFNTDNVSRIQSSIFYDWTDECWYLVDSTGEVESMNGTWFLAAEYNILDNNSIIKAGTTSFQCNYIYPEEEIFDDDN
jgi:hypothetical protein